MKFLIRIVCLAALLTACSPTTLKDYQLQGISLMRALTKELRSINSREDIKKREKRLEKLYVRISQNLIEARILYDKEPGPTENAYLEEVAYTLKEELVRVYQIEGARPLLEAAQASALNLLDEFETKKKLESESGTNPFRR